MSKKQLIETIINSNGPVKDWGWDRMGVYSPDHGSDKYTAAEIHENKHDENFMRDVARDFFDGFTSTQEIGEFCTQHGFLFNPNFC